MTNHDDHNTEAALTQQAGPPSTDLPSPTTPEAPDEWSLDDDAETDYVPTSNWYRRAGILGFIAIIAACILIPLLTEILKSGGSKQAQPQAKPSTNVTASAGSLTPGFSAYDEKFLSLMTQEGWGCTDNAGVENCNKQMVNFAHQVCSYAGQPVDLVYQYLGLPAFLGPGEERMAIANAEQAYPNCTLTESP